MYLKLLTVLTLIITVVFAENKGSGGDLTSSEIKKKYYDSYELEKQQRYKEAMVALSEIIKKYPNGYTVNFRLGWLAYNNGSFADAIKYYNKALTIYPASLEIMAKKVLVYVAQKKWSTVEEECRKMLRISYYDGIANYWFSYSLRIQGKYDEAMKIVLGYISVYPTSTTMLVELGLLQDAKGDVNSAIGTFQSVEILDPYNQIAKSYLKK